MTVLQKKPIEHVLNNPATHSRLAFDLKEAIDQNPRENTTVHTYARALTHTMPTQSSAQALGLGHVAQECES